MYRNWIVGLLLVHLCMGCHWFKKKESINTTALAQIGDKKLLVSDLTTYLPMGLSKEDSIKYARHFIERWVAKTLIAEKSIQNIPKIEQSIHYQVEDYRNDLLVHLYQNQFLNQKLDTVVTENMIKEYYQAHPQDFELKQTVIQANFLKVPKNERELNNTRRWMASKNVKDKDNLMQFALSKAQKMSVDSAWHYWSNIVQEFPDKNIDEAKTITANKLYEQQDEGYVYLLYIYNKKYSHEVTPLELIQKSVKEVIIGQRREKLLQDMEQNIIEDAQKNNRILYGKQLDTISSKK